MRVYCAWCLEEGVLEEKAFLYDKEPLEDLSVSHGICPRHAEDLHALILKETSGPRRPNPSAFLVKVLGEKKALALEVAYAGDLRNILTSPAGELQRHGLTAKDAEKVSLARDAIEEFMAATEAAEERPRLRGPEDIFRWFVAQVGNLELEQFWIGALDSKNRVFQKYLISQGTINMSIVHPREVFTPLVRGRAAAFVCVHNHPTGDPTPSPEDIEITRRLQSVATLVGIRLLDHVVIGRGGQAWISLKQRGLMGMD